MAVAPGDIPITREMVIKWINTWKKSRSKTKGTIQDYIRKQVDALELGDPMVNTDVEGRDEFQEETHAADLIIADLPSYGVKIAPGS